MLPPQLLAFRMNHRLVLLLVAAGANHLRLCKRRPAASGPPPLPSFGDWRWESAFALPLTIHGHPQLAVFTLERTAMQYTFTVPWFSAPLVDQ